MTSTLRRRAAATVPLLVSGMLLAGCASGTGAALPESPAATPPPSLGPTETPTAGLETANMLSSWAFDVTDVQQVVHDADTVLVAQVTRIDEMATFDLARGAPPKTRVEVQALQTMKGEFSASGALYVSGGTVTLQQVFESQEPESSKKSGITDVDDNERRSSLVEYVPQEPVDLEVGREYVFMLRHSEELDVYAVAADGFGVFDVTGSGFTNRITGETVTTERLRAMIAAE